MQFDVAIIGGGPGGSTCAGFLRKYAPQLSVAVFERERFPREHVGESQLPAISQILAELDCWEAVEAAGFPIKIGATYRWGRSDRLWDFEFMPLDAYVEEPRPRSWSQQARRLALQVDRAVYDKILLDHAAALGAQVFEETQVRKVHSEGDRVEALLLDDGREVRARHYVDASGGAAVLRRALGVAIDCPTRLQNIAFWDYWENAEWATRYPGGATRVLVLSIGCGWIWFIPLGPTRTSIGFVCPREHYAERGMSPDALYRWALSQEPLIAQLTANATRTGEVRATKDWSFVSERAAGDNWMLVGEAAGFADPILAAGMTLTHSSAREAAYTIIEGERGEHDPHWLRRSYDDNQRERIRQHIRFADFWYSANGVFTDLQAYTREIARDAGLDLTPEKAFQWLGTGGFTQDLLGQPSIGGLDLSAARTVVGRFVDGEKSWDVGTMNHFRLSLEGAESKPVPSYRDGRIDAITCHCRNGRRLPEFGLFGAIIRVLRHGCDIHGLVAGLRREAVALAAYAEPDVAFKQLVQALEFMIGEGWVSGAFDPRLPRLEVRSSQEGRSIHSNQDLAGRLARLGAAG